MTKTKIVGVAIMVILGFLLLPIGTDTQNDKKANSEAPVKPQEEIKGKVSWYDYSLEAKDQKCRQNEVCYSQIADTCASRDYMRGTMLKIEYKDKSVICRVNDYVENPDVVIDLSSHAFKQLAPLSKGVIDVKIVELNN